MKKILITGFLWGLLIPLAFSQSVRFTEVAPYTEADGHHYLKRIENNFKVRDGVYNINSKGAGEILFFGNVNAPVEFFYEKYPKNYYGFRVVMDSVRKTHILEIKNISNYKEVDFKTFYKCADTINTSSISPDTLVKYRGPIIYSRYEAMRKLYKVETFSFPISEPFAEKLYEKMSSFIINFKSKGFSGFSMGIHICYSTFRIVIDNDELWTLRIDDPKGNALKWSDFCRRIIEDAIAGEFIEVTYLQMLEYSM